MSWKKVLLTNKDAIANGNGGQENIQTSFKDLTPHIMGDIGIGDDVDLQPLSVTSASSSAVAQVSSYTLTGTPVNSTAYDIEVGTTTFTFTSTGTTLAGLATGLAGLITANSLYTATSSAGVITVTAVTAGVNGAFTASNQAAVNGVTINAAEMTAPVDATTASTATAAQYFTALGVPATNPLVLRVNADGDLGWGQGAPENVLISEEEGTDGLSSPLANGAIPMGVNSSDYAVAESNISQDTPGVTINDNLFVSSGKLSSLDGGINVLDNFTVDATGNTLIKGTLNVDTNTATFAATSVHTAGITSGSNIISDTDGIDNLGSSNIRWKNVYTDSIGDVGQALGVGATTLSFDAASTIDTSGDYALTIDTAGANIVLTAASVNVGTNLDVNGLTTLNKTQIDGDSTDDGYIIHTNIGYDDSAVADTWVENKVDKISTENLKAVTSNVTGDFTHTGNLATFGKGALTINTNTGTDSYVNLIANAGVSPGTMTGTDKITVKNTSASPITLSASAYIYLALDQGGSAKFYPSASTSNSASAVVIAADTEVDVYITTTDMVWDLQINGDRQTFAATDADPQTLFSAALTPDSVVFSDGCFIDGGATIVASSNFSTTDTFMNLNADASDNTTYATAAASGIVFGYNMAGDTTNESKGGKLVSHDSGMFSFRNLDTDTASPSVVATNDTALGTLRPVQTQMLGIEPNSTIEAVTPVTGNGTLGADTSGNLFYYHA